jgi:hypothetical protein
MTDLLERLVLDHGLAAILGIASIAIQLWMAKWIFSNLLGINRNLARLLERNGHDTDPPPMDEPRRRHRGGVSRLLPRAPTPLPFWPVPQPDNKEEG